MCASQMGLEVLNWWHFGGHQIHIAMGTWWGKYSFHTLGYFVREKNSMCRLAKIWTLVEAVWVCYWFILCCSEEWHGREKTVGRSHLASKGKVEVSMNIFVIKVWKIVAIFGSKFIQCCQTGSSKTEFVDTKIIWVKFPGSSLPHPDRD